MGSLRVPALGKFGIRALEGVSLAADGAGKAFLGTAFLLACLLVLASGPAMAAEDPLLGITWQDSVLVSFDPRAGEILVRHLQMNPYEAFRGLAYDPNHHRLYALAQSTRNLYWIDTETLALNHVGNLRIKSPTPGWSLDAGTLVYDPAGDTLYTAVEHWQADYRNPWSEICAIDPATAVVECLGRINGPFIDGLAYGPADRQLYGLALFESGSWDSPAKAHVVQISPPTGQMDILFKTPYHTVMGLAASGPYSFYSWINWTTHLYGEIDLLARTVTPLAPSDPVGVIAAMERKSFPLGSAPVVPDPEPASFVFSGHVTSVWDPGGHLAKEIAKGRSFVGKFSYDTTAPYRYDDPNGSPPYGLTVRVNRQLYACGSLRAGVTDNYFSATTQSVSDGFSLSASDPMLHAAVSWSLADATATALSGNARLPSEFDLSQWQRNTFVITGYDVYSVRPVYSIIGTVEHISEGEAFSAAQKRKLRQEAEEEPGRAGEKGRPPKPLPHGHGGVIP